MGKKLILFVKPNAFIRKMFMRELQQDPQIDCEIIEAGNGSKGLEELSKLLAENRIPDLIIAGIFMHGMNDFKFASEVFKIQGMEKVPVLFLDNCFYDMIREQLLTLGKESNVQQVVFLNVSGKMEDFHKIVSDLLSGGLSDEGKKIVEEEKKKLPKTSVPTENRKKRKRQSLGLGELFEKIT